MLGRLVTAAMLTIALISSPVLASGDQTINYSGRLVDALAQPLAGPVDLEIRFFNQSTAGAQLGPTKEFEGVVLAQGVFQVDLELTPAQQALVFGPGSDVWVEVKNVGVNKTYPRQRFSAVPYAIRVPVDGATISWNADGELEVLDVSALQHSAINFDGGANDIVLQAPSGVAAPVTLTLPPDAGGLGQVLTTDGSGLLTWTAKSTGAGNMDTSVYDNAPANSKIDLLAGGTGSDLSATGGAGQYVKQSSAGGNLSVGVIADADLPASVARDTELPTIGGDVQAFDPALQSISGLATLANQLIYTTAADTYTTTSLTAAGRAILDDVDAAAQRTTLGLVIGTNVQAYDAQLADVAGLTPSDNNFVVGNGTIFVAESGATARTSLGAAASGANGDITSLTGLTTALSVAQGGTGAATLAANNVLLGNGTSAPQAVAPGSSGNVLTSNGTTWTSSAAGGGLTACPAGFSLIGTAGKRGAFCIDTNERSVANFENAKNTCEDLSLAEGEAFLCNANEWHAACRFGGPSNMTDDYEWVADYSYIGAAVLGNGSCSSGFYDTGSSTNPYRCCIH